MRRIVYGSGWLARTSFVLGLAIAAIASAQEAPSPVVATEQPPSGPTLKWQLEVKTVYRDSEDKSFPVPFNFAALGVPQQLERTVDPGRNLEVPAVTLYLDANWGESLQGHVRADYIDLYYRNPTSTDHDVDVHEAWLRLGRDADPGRVPEHWGLYAKIGKFPKLERQNDRHLESYGLASTAFNRTEDIGVEAGLDARWVFVKTSYTRGNPLFVRDPDALAGDNGTAANLDPEGPHPALHSGIPILYDAEVEDVSGSGHEQTGVALGARASNADGSRRFELLGFRRQRTLADRVELFGTLYGGDLRVIDNPQFHLPGIEGRDKTETGGNLWVYFDGLSLFSQYVHQEIAGLERNGYEAELAWHFELPLFASFAGQQLFPSIQPAVRYSKLDPKYVNPPPPGPTSKGTPVPSLAWQWEKTDAGLRIGIVPGTDLTVEQQHNRFLTKAGWRTLDELLATLRWRL